MKSSFVAYALVLSLIACTSEKTDGGGTAGSGSKVADASGKPPGKTPADTKPVAAKPPAGATPATAKQPAAKEPSPIDKFAHVDAAGAAKLITDEATLVILDVRTPNEFRRGHLKGALNMDITMSSFQKKIADLDKKAHYLVHCQSGTRSTSALHKLAKLDFVKVTHLDGGIAAWMKAGNPVEK